MDFNKSKTKENLARAFAGICQDGARYQFISKSASSEGYEYISNELKSIAINKMAHASVLYKLMLDKIEGYKDNVNIEAGYPFENYKLSTSLASSAEIEKILTLICEVNLKNAQKIESLAEMFDSGSLYSAEKEIEWECSNCGHYENKKDAWENCPLCGYPQGYVKIKNNS